MTRKHFEGIAECLKSVRTQIGDYKEGEDFRNFHSHICYLLAARLQGFNENFNVDRFLKACGIVEDK